MEPGKEPSGMEKDAGRAASELADLETVSQEHCPSCEAVRQGPFCYGCGQRFLGGRLSLPFLWRQLPARIFNMDRGLVRTFFELTRHPGRTPTRYVAGKRSPYLNPLTYFLLATAIQLLGLSLTEDRFRQDLVGSLEQGLQKDDARQTIFQTRTPEEVADLQVSIMKQGYTYLFLFTVTLPFAFFLRLLHRAEPRFNQAETLIFSLYSTAHMVLLTGLMLPFTIRLGAAIHGVIAQAITISYVIWAARTFFGPGWRRALATLVSYLGSFLCFTVALAFLVGLVIGVEG